MQLTRRTALKAGVASATGGYVGSELLRDSDAHVSRSADWGEQAEPAPYEDYEVHRVSPEEGERPIQAAVDEANPRDLILLEPGVYTEEVVINDTPWLTIRGLDREGVVIDGEYDRYNGIRTTVDGVVVENLTVKNHAGNGVYWTNGVTGYRSSYVTAVRNGAYGVYAFSSQHGRFEHCYSSGCDDAGYYIGESQPAHAVITDCLAEQNAMGYSGTNAGGDLVIRNSTWRNNAVGIVPNTLDSQRGAPQGHVAGGVRVENNEIYDNSNLDVPMTETAYAISGIGVVVVGGVGNDVCDNRIEGHDKYGVAVIPILTGDDNLYRPRDNAVMRNEVRDSGRVDLALSAPAKNNAFADNEFGSSRPVFLERRDGSFGDIWVFLVLFTDFMQSDEIGDYPDGEVEDVPDPDPDDIRAELDEYEMDAPSEEPPKPPVGGLNSA